MDFFVFECACVCTFLCVFLYVCMHVCMCVCDLFCECIFTSFTSMKLLSLPSCECGCNHPVVCCLVQIIISPQVHACMRGWVPCTSTQVHACMRGWVLCTSTQVHACMRGWVPCTSPQVHACMRGWVLCTLEYNSGPCHACVGGWVSCTSPQIMCTCSPTGQMYALRLYLDMMVHELYGFNQTGEFFARLLHLRFRGLEDLFPPHPNDPMLCSRRTEGKIPTAIHVHGYVKLDMQLMSSHFRKLLPEAMDILFMDYVEEISAQV